MNLIISMIILLQLCEASMDNDDYPVKSLVLGKEQTTFRQEASKKLLTVRFNSIFPLPRCNRKTAYRTEFLAETVFRIQNMAESA